MAQVEFRGVTKVYPGGVEAISALDLEIGDGERFAIVGPSGSGKSTLLRLIAGLEAPTSGSLWIDGRRADGLSPRDRDVAMVFQNPTSYPYLTVFENLAFGLRARGQGRSEIEARVAEVAARLDLAQVLARWPQHLSGGQRQRVALGRAIVRRPRVFLLDEPLSSLDAPLRASLRAELIDLHRQLATTMIYVTHDQAEALALGDRIAVMDRGRLVQKGTPQQVYQHPSSRFVARFVGNPPMNILPCVFDRLGETLRIRAVGVAREDAWTVPVEEEWVASLRRQESGRVDLGLRPEHVSLSVSSPATWTALGEVGRLEPLGHESIVTLTIGRDRHPLSLRVAALASPRLGDRLTVGLDAAHAVWFDAGTGEALNPTPSRIAGSAPTG